MIELKDTIDLYTNSVDKVEFYWNFYSVVVISIIGWLLSERRKLPHHLKLLAIGGFLFFAAMNLYNLMGAYTLSDALQDDLRYHLANSRDHGLEQTQQVFANAGFKYQKPAAMAVHLVIATAVVLMIWQTGTRQPAGKGSTDSD